MGKKNDFIKVLSDRTLLILALYEQTGSLESLREVLPEITAEDLEKCAEEAATAMQLYQKSLGVTRTKTKKTRDKVGGFQLKMTLRGSKPPIWRRVIVPADMTLGDLHTVIQVAMGWHGGHLHEFNIDGTAYVANGPEDAMYDDMDGEDEAEYQLREVLREKMKFDYVYDFGDNWEHLVTVEKVIAAQDKRPAARCTAGKLHCPAEDSGGLWGYYEKLEILADKKHPEHAEISEWMGEDFDAQNFDIEYVNTTLAEMKL